MESLEIAKYSLALVFLSGSIIIIYPILPRHHSERLNWLNVSAFTIFTLALMHASYYFLQWAEEEFFVVKVAIGLIAAFLILALVSNMVADFIRDQFRIDIAPGIYAVAIILVGLLGIIFFLFYI